MAKESKKPIHFIINKAEGTLAEKMTVKVGKEKVIGIVAFSPSVQEKGLLGQALDATSLNIAAVTSFVLHTLNEKQTPTS